MTADDMVFASRRSPVYGTAGMVATSQPLAVQAGVDVLSAGGNAADAAVAAAAVLAVTEPCSNGVGGDCFALYYDAATATVSALNGSGRAPAALSLDRVSALPAYHANTVTVPGAVAGWCDVIARLGTRPLDELLAPAIGLARNGFAVAPITAFFWAAGARRQLAEAANAGELLIDGRAPEAGERFANPNVAATLQRVASDGAAGFYCGATAAAIVDVIAAGGGVMTADDLAAHESSWVEPISTEYAGHIIYECPPNGQGLVALLALNILRELGDVGAPLSPQRLHLTIEALRLAFADGQRYIADPDAVAVPSEALLDHVYARRRAGLVDPAHARADVVAGSPLASSDTVYLTVIDSADNACSFIQSNYMGFGTGIVPRGCGFSMQNRGHNFSLDPAHPNALAPGKRPYHTIIPAMATRADGTLYASFGVMGGFMQPQGHTQVVLALVDDGVDPQTALDRPRLCIQPGGGPVALEQGTPADTQRALQQMGHRITEVGGPARALFGRGQIIVRQRDGVLCGGSDPRADGCAATPVS